MSDVNEKQFSEEEIQNCINFFKSEFNKDISTLETKEFLQKVKEMENYERELSDYNFQMQKIEDTMWRESTNNLIQNGITPLVTF